MDKMCLLATLEGKRKVGKVGFYRWPLIVNTLRFWASFIGAATIQTLKLKTKLSSNKKGEIYSSKPGPKGIVVSCFILTLL